MSIRSHSPLVHLLSLLALSVPAGAQLSLSGTGCEGPLGSVIPGCQSSARALPAVTPHRDAPASPVIRTGPTPSAAGPQANDSPIVPPPPGVNEFQRFAASSLGQTLPIFGVSLFEHVPTTFAPLDRVPVTSDYVIGPGDEILLRAWGQVSLDLALTVDRTGNVFIPQAGNITVAGLQFQQLPGFLRSQLERIYRNFDLTVNMGQLRSVEIFVVGQVRRPGTYTVSSLSTLVNALFASGGPSSQGSMRHIQLKRAGRVVTEFDLYDLLLKGDKAKDARLLPGDVVYIPGAGPQVAIAGAVKHPAIFELNSETTTGDLIQLAGGLSVIADVAHATLERIQDRAALRTFDITLDPQGLAMPIAPGDILHIQTITPRFDNAVTVRGHVANPGRFPWRPGMRLRDVVPDKESLIVREYWSKRNGLGFAPQEVGIPDAPASEAARTTPRTDIESLVPDINWSYAVIERQNARDLATELVPFHPGKLILDRDDAQNLALQSGDVVTFFSQADIHVPLEQQRRFVRLEGELAAAGVYAVRPGETLGQLIERAGGLTRQAYLFGAELTRDATRADQQRRLDEFTREMEVELERAAGERLAASVTAEDAATTAAKLESQRRMVDRLRQVKATGRIVLNLEPGDSSVAKLMEIPLEHGDKFVVPSRPSTVNVLGAVYNQNAFLYQSKLRVADYLRDAGGPTRNADSGRMFIIRADGRVVPHKGVRRFEAMVLNPGDSVVLPEQLMKGSFLRGLRDWTQVFAQLALGAAAVNILR